MAKITRRVQVQRAVRALLFYRLMVDLRESRQALNQFAAETGHHCAHVAAYYELGAHVARGWYMEAHDRADELDLVESMGA